MDPLEKSKNEKEARRKQKAAVRGQKKNEKKNGVGVNDTLSVSGPGSEGGTRSSALAILYVLVLRRERVIPPRAHRTRRVVLFRRVGG